MIGCGSDDGSIPSGILTDSAVSGLNYKSAAFQGLTDADGKFNYWQGETVTFSIGNLTLGSATGAARMTPLSITSGATSASDQAVNNKLILLQTLDADGENRAVRRLVALRETSFVKGRWQTHQSPLTLF